MARRKMQPGVCRLCGTDGMLTYEHVPPRAAFNSSTVVYHKMHEWLETSGRWKDRGHQQQGGAGAYTLCERCNNTTGSWYGEEYVRWARAGLEALARMPEADPGTFVLAAGVRPLRFLKQAVVMMFSVNSPEFQSRNRELVRFVLNREARHLPARYNMYLTLVRGHARSIGVSGKMSLDAGRSELLCEVAHCPFAFLMTIGDVVEDRMGRISHFGEYAYDQRADVSLCVAVGQVYTPYPGDYRLERELPSRTGG